MYKNILKFKKILRKTIHKYGFTYQKTELLLKVYINMYICRVFLHEINY